jgi:hypothetical protein
MASPLQIILNDSDYQQARDAGGGGPRKDFFANRDREFRDHKAALINQLETIARTLDGQAQAHGDIGYVKVILRREAWANDHGTFRAVHLASGTGGQSNSSCTHQAGGYHGTDQKPLALIVTSYSSRIILLEIFVFHQVFGPVRLHLVEMLNLIGGEPLVNGRVQWRIGINLSQRLGPFQSAPKIARLASIVLRTARIGIQL